MYVILIIFVKIGERIYNAIYCLIDMQIKRFHELKVKPESLATLAM